MPRSGRALVYVSQKPSARTPEALSFPKGPGFRVWGSGFRIQGLGFSINSMYIGPEVSM